jgi:SAM-dependent methyltransferase
MNIDKKTVDGFGDEWTRFDQSEMSLKDVSEVFNKYFLIFPWQDISTSVEGFDLGCGSGRWARLVAPRVAKLHCIDPSDAINVAKKNLINHPNCIFHKAGVDNIPLADGSMDFGYSLGVLHHIPDTQSALSSCVKKLKVGAPFLVYLYYSFDNRPLWFRILWRSSDLLRRLISKMPYDLRYWCSQLLAGFVYWPLANIARISEKMGIDVSNFPLSFYRNHGFYVMRTDALDRFGTRLEQRFSKKQITDMMISSGLTDIAFSERDPYWCAIGYAKAVS